MEFTTDRDALLEALERPSAAVPDKATGVYGCVVVAAKQDGVVLTGGDPTHVARSILSGTDKAPLSVGALGQAAIAPQLFLDAVRGMPKGQIKVKRTDNAVRFSSGKRRLDVHCLDADGAIEFPRVEGDTVSLKAESLRKMLACVKLSASPKMPATNGVFVEVTPEAILVIALDGQRIVRCDSQREANSSGSCRFLLPLPAVKNVLSLLQEIEEGDVLVTHASKDILFSSKDLSSSVSSRETGAVFPAVLGMIPPETADASVVLDLGTLIASLTAIAGVSETANSFIKLTPDEFFVKLDSTASSAGVDAIPCKSSNIPAGWKDTAFVNVALIAQVLKAFEGEDIRFGIHPEAHAVTARNSFGAMFLKQMTAR